MSDRDKILADLSAYLDGELSPAQAQRVEQAAGSDADLARELAGFRRTRDLVRGLPRAEPPEDFVAGVLAKAERFRLVQPSAEPAAGGLPWFRWLAAAAVLLVAAGVGVTVAVMLYTAPPAGRGGAGPVAMAPPPSPASSARPTPAKDLARLGGARDEKAADVEGLSGNSEILYARRDEFDAALDSVNGVLIANGVQPAGSSRQDSNGQKQVTILVYADPQQAQQVRAGLEQFRNRRQVSEAAPSAEAPAVTSGSAGGGYSFSGATAVMGKAGEMTGPATAPAERPSKAGPAEENNNFTGGTALAARLAKGPAPSEPEAPAAAPAAPAAALAAPASQPFKGASAAQDRDGVAQQQASPRQDQPQVVGGLAGDQYPNQARQSGGAGSGTGALANQAPPAGTGGRGGGGDLARQAAPASQPAVVYSQAKWNAQPLLITLRSEPPPPPGQSEAGRVSAKAGAPPAAPLGGEVARLGGAASGSAASAAPGARRAETPATAAATSMPATSSTSAPASQSAAGK